MRRKILPTAASGSQSSRSQSPISQPINVTNTMPCIARLSRSSTPRAVGENTMLILQMEGRSWYVAHVVSSPSGVAECLASLNAWRPCNSSPFPVLVYRAFRAFSNLALTARLSCNAYSTLPSFHARKLFLFPTSFTTPTTRVRLDRPQPRIYLPRSVQQHG